MSRRLFVAVDPDGPARARLAALAGELRARVERTKGPRITWVAPDRLHVTLHFVGDVEETRTACLVDRLMRPLDVPPLEITIDRVGVFPPRGRPRVVWAGGAATDAVRLLHRRVGEQLAACGSVPDERPFSPHVTLGRVRDARGPLGPLPAVGAAIRLAVTRVTLYESQLSSDGPVYTALAHAALPDARN